MEMKMVSKYNQQQADFWQRKEKKRIFSFEQESSK
jgi:hypothetical protein